MISIEVFGPPVPKGRPIFLRTPQRRAGGKGLRYAITPRPTAAYEAALTMLARAVMRGRAPLSGPIKLRVTAAMRIPASFNKARRALAVAGALRPTTRPDWDNFGKITDALNGVVWEDDSQVVEATVIKIYAEAPRLLITIEEFTDGPGHSSPRD